LSLIIRTYISDPICYDLARKSGKRARKEIIYMLKGFIRKEACFYAFGGWGLFFFVLESTYKKTKKPWFFCISNLKKYMKQISRVKMIKFASEFWRKKRGKKKGVGFFEWKKNPNKREWANHPKGLCKY